MNMHYVSMDHRGHGMSKWDKHKNRTDGHVDWSYYGRDITLLTKQHIESLSNSCHDPSSSDNSVQAIKSNHRTIGVGHSMGATALILSALENPTLYSGGLLLFEPILFPRPVRYLMNLIPNLDAPLAKVSRKRRETFPSYQIAVNNFSSKHPMKSFHPAVTQDYVRYGFRPVNSEDTDCLDTDNKYDYGPTFKSEEKSIQLLCHPQYEAEIYNGGSRVMAYDQDIELLNRADGMNIPVWIIASKYRVFEPSTLAYLISTKIHNSRLLYWEDAHHFGPMQFPHRLGKLIQEMGDQNY